MSRKSLELRRSFIKVDDGAEIALWDTGGKGRPVVLVHGFPENHHSWFPLLERLFHKVKKNYRYILYDLRGHGESSKTGEASLNRFFADHLSIIKSLKLGKYHLVGHDWGGAVALHVARYVPQTLKSLVVMDTNYWKVDYFGMMHLVFLNLPLIPELSFRFFPEKVFEIGMRKAYVNFNRLPAEIKENYRVMFRDGETTHYWIRLYRDLARKFLTQNVPGLSRFAKQSSVLLPRTAQKVWKVPTTLIWGKGDRFTPEWVGRDIFNRLCKKTDVTFHSVPRSGHFVQIEQPAKVAKLLKEHLCEHD